LSPRLSQQLLVSALQDELKRQAVLTLDIDSRIAQPTELVEKTFKRLLQREISAASISLPRRLGAQLDRLNDPRWWVKPGQPLVNRKAFDYAKTQRFDNFNGPEQAGIQR
jgi:hypothetical protein